MLDIKNYNAPLDYLELVRLIKESEDTGEEINPKVEGLLKDSLAGLMLWSVLYKKQRLAILEDYLSKVDSVNDEYYTIISYFKNFPETKDGPLWDTLLKSPELCIEYALSVREGRFPEGEPTILVKEEVRKSYIEYLKLMNEDLGSLE